jgi:hypothetical protein
VTADTRRIWQWPVAIAVLTASGLASALVSDGWGDAWAWASLAVPLAVIAWCAARGHRALPEELPASSNRPTP